MQRLVCKNNVIVSAAMRDWSYVTFFFALD